MGWVVGIWPLTGRGVQAILPQNILKMRNLGVNSAPLFQLTDCTSQELFSTSSFIIGEYLMKSTIWIKLFKSLIRNALY